MKDRFIHAWMLVAALVLLLGRAHPLRGPAARVAIPRATIAAPPAVNAREAQGVWDLPPALPPTQPPTAGRAGGQRIGGDGPIAPGHQSEAQTPRRSSRPTSDSRSTWPPPCGSPTPGR